MIGVGDIVVCVNGKWLRPDADVQQRPILGVIYTIREYVPSFMFKEGPADAVRLEEIVNQPLQWFSGFYEVAFYVDRFRPVHKSSIEIFRQIAANPKQKVLV